MPTFTVKLDDDTFRKLAAAAERIGVTPERLAEMTLESLWLDDDGARPSGREPAGFGEPAREWSHHLAEAGAPGDADDRPTTPEDYEGPFVDLDDALDTFSKELDRRPRRRPG